MATIKILVWNVMNLSTQISGPGDRGQSSIQTRARLIGELIAKMDTQPDIIFLLEMGIDGAQIGEIVSNRYTEIMKGFIHGRKNYSLIASEPTNTVGSSSDLEEQEGRLETYVMLFDKGLTRSNSNEDVLNFLKLSWHDEIIYSNLLGFNRRITQANPTYYRGAWIINTSSLELGILHAPYTVNGDIDDSGVTHKSGNSTIDQRIAVIKQMADQMGSTSLLMGDFNIPNDENKYLQQTLGAKLNQWGPGSGTPKKANETSLKQVFTILTNLTTSDFALNNSYDQGFATPNVTVQWEVPTIHFTKDSFGDTANEFYSLYGKNFKGTFYQKLTELESSIPEPRTSRRSVVNFKLTAAGCEVITTAKKFGDKNFDYVKALDNVQNLIETDGQEEGNDGRAQKRRRLTLDETFYRTFSKTYKKFKAAYTEPNSDVSAASVQSKFPSRFCYYLEEMSGILAIWEQISSTDSNVLPDPGTPEHYAFYRAAISDHLPVLHTLTI